jgi:hypothetical protein
MISETVGGAGDTVTFSALASKTLVWPAGNVHF